MAPQLAKLLPLASALLWLLAAGNPTTETCDAGECEVSPSARGHGMLQKLKPKAGLSQVEEAESETDAVNDKAKVSEKDAKKAEVEAGEKDAKKEAAEADKKDAKKEAAEADEDAEEAEEEEPEGFPFDEELEAAEEEVFEKLEKGDEEARAYERYEEDIATSQANLDKYMETMAKEEGDDDTMDGGDWSLQQESKEVPAVQEAPPQLEKQVAWLKGDCVASERRLGPRAARGAAARAGLGGRGGR
eukprot:CAMPEP_0168396372 /NCGR_PEP_ID=MMETSP0228-20121227/20515_1 /TAXON_ID=133427 /ORGANISM="Protoceratium reticulatum, Strain CCCM 535 (=CCMP 1889)" /LENGTH=245 /DNA_ID=CAMNT_0008409813 /DNA_START=63 /DNA_END=798 /DNA_ORIENTATION=+